MGLCQIIQKETFTAYFSLQRTVIVFGRNPLPPGHSCSYSSESSGGHTSHRGPQALPMEQQQVDCVTGSPRGSRQMPYLFLTLTTSRKHSPSRRSVRISGSLRNHSKIAHYVSSSDGASRNSGFSTYLYH